MTFSFYPKLEHGCPNVSHCPHLGGAAVGTVGRLANETLDSRQYLFRTIDAERETVSRLLQKIERLETELEQAKLELKLERQNKFATNQQKQVEATGSTSERPASSTRKKRGAPAGHTGWFRKTPTEYDWAIEVRPPQRCLYCPGRVTVDPAFAPSEHLQEDVIDGQ